MPFALLSILLVNFIFNFAEAQGPINISDARQTTLLALSSYCGNSRVNSSFNCYWCRMEGVNNNFRFVASWNNPTSKIFGFTGIKGNTIYVAWRGTVLTDIDNWAKNFQLNQVNYPPASGAKVHSGFFSNYNSARDQSLAAVTKAVSLCPGCKITVTGHSLGGALATFSALDIARGISNNIFLLTLSGPRVGNGAFADYVQRTISHRWRIVNKADLVPHVPFSLFQSFKHFGGEAWNIAGNQIVYCNDGESQSCSNKLGFLRYNVLDHAAILGFNLLIGANNGCLADVNNKRNINDDVLID